MKFIKIASQNRLFAALCGLFLTLTTAADVQETNRLTKIRTWMCLLDGVERLGTVEALAKTRYGMLVVEPTVTIRGNEGFDIVGAVAALHKKLAGRLVLAYVDIGEAETYRTYWKDNWKVPAKNAAGNPDFLLNANPDGWDDCYVAAYWDKRWQKIVLEQVETLMYAGFDGIYLDVVDGYEDESVVAAAKRAKVDPAKAMVDFIGKLRQRIRAVNNQAVIIGQNADYLIDVVPSYLKVIDGAAFEDTWFSGRPDAKWANPRGGDISNRYQDENSTKNRLNNYRKYLAAGKPVFTIDYCLKWKNAEMVYNAARKQGLVPLVTRVSLANITTTPPPWLKEEPKTGN
jgi:cysteinyl-tRNA synthetase